MGSVLINSAVFLAKRGLLGSGAKAVLGDDPIDEEPVDDSPDDSIPEDGGFEDTNPVAEEIFSSWALFIVLFLLGAALWSSYYLQQKRVKAVHETVLSIFYGMVVGLIIRISPGHYIQDAVKFNSSYFFNILLPPIILNSGYELHQANFFRNIGSILTFAIPGTFVSSIVIGIILFIYTKLGLESISLSFIDTLAVGATLSATDPVTILSIFNSYKVDPKLYTIIFGESLLNDAICIVMFETCEKFHGKDPKFSNLFEGIGLFLMTFTISTLIGLMVGVIVALVLKHSLIRRHPQIETCLVLLFAYESYFFSNGCHMSGIVSLLFCGITMKHYAYYNMSRRTQIATKYIFQLLAQLSENFIFIYLGLSLFTEVELVFKPLLIIVSFISICIARWAAVFPLSRFINWVSRSRSLARGLSVSSINDEIPYNYQMMQFWAGLRGAVGVALAMGIQGEAKSALLATVLVVVVLTVILFGGTTANMLEMLNIKTGCIEESESDDEFDIEAPNPNSFAAGNHTNNVQLNSLAGGVSSSNASKSMYSSYNKYKDTVPIVFSDQQSSRSRNNSQSNLQDDLAKNIQSVDSLEDLMGDSEAGDLDGLPPIAGYPIQSATSSTSNNNLGSSRPYQNEQGAVSSLTFSNILSVDEHAKWFTNFDENVLKPALLDNSPTKQSQDKK